MRTDKELLILAAKGAGIKLKVIGDNQWRIDANGQTIGYWNPLTDDGDAFRLAVALGLTVIVAVHGDDPYAATRRAIVRAGAAIGRTMP